ncbi:MAG: response regulator [Desulfobacter sp.]|nr:MAG: response regulator [Desulfobacter sp.]
MKNLSIRAQLLMGFSILTAIIVIVGGVSLTFVYQSKSNVETLLNVTSPLASESGSLFDEINKSQSLFRSLLKASDETDIRRITRILENSDQKKDKSFETIITLIEERRDLNIDTGSLRQIRQTYFEQTQQVVKLNQNRLAHEKTLHHRQLEFNQQIHRLETSLSAFANTAYSLIGEQEEEIRTTIQARAMKIEEMEERISIVFNLIFPQVDAANKIHEYIIQIQSLLTSALIEKDAEKLAQLEKEIAKAFRKIENRLKRIRARVELQEEHACYHRVENALGQLTQTALNEDGLLTVYNQYLAAEKAVDAAFARLNTEMVTVQKILGEVFDTTHTIDRKAQNSVLDGSISSIFAIWISIFLGLVISIISGIIILKGITGPVEHMKNMISEIKAGNLRNRLRLDSKNELGVMANELDEFVDELQFAVDTVNATMARIASGDFSEKTKIQLQGNDEVGRLATSFNVMLGQVRSSQQELTHTKNYLHNVIQTMTDSLIVIDTQKTIKLINKTVLDQTGARKEDLLGQHISVLLPEGKHSRISENDIDQLFTLGTVKDLEYEFSDQEGRKKTILVSTSVMKGASTQIEGLVIVVQDISERKNAEANRLRLEQELHQSQKMKAIGTLAGGIAHDFNNILAGMIGFTQLALMDTKDRPSTNEMLGRVLEAGGRATDLVRQILSFSRSQKGEVSLFRPVAIVKEVLKLMRASIPSTIEIKQSLNSKSYIQADATNIHQVLMNLCTNAVHAMKQKGGVLSIKLQDVVLDQEDLSSRPDMLAGEFLKITVEDTGTGMASDIQKKAFDPFFTTKEMGEGTGIGLSTVHKIITDLGGFISLYSEPDQGTAMHIFIPIISAPEGIESAIAIEPAQGGTERILFVDDEQIQLDVARETMSRYGYRVKTFLDSTQAADHFQQHADAYDLVITDMTMPKMTGDLLVKKIHLKRPDIPIIICTGFSEILDEQKAQALNIDAFLYKPVIMADLLETIRKVLDKKE